MDTGEMEGVQKVETLWLKRGREVGAVETPSDSRKQH